MLSDAYSRGNGGRDHAPESFSANAADILPRRIIVTGASLREYLRTVALRLLDQMRLPRNGCSIICEEAARMVWCQIVQHPQDALGGFIRL